MIQLKFVVGGLAIVLLTLVGIDTYYDTSCKRINALTYEGTSIESAFFPLEAINSGGQQFIDLDTAWLTEELVKLKEPSLWEVSDVCEAAVYRFLLLSDVNPPMALRLVMRQDGASTLHVKSTEANDETTTGLRSIQESLILSDIETEELISRIRSSDFWNRPSGLVDSGEATGSHWLFEGAKGGNYQFISASDSEEGVFYELGMEFLNARKLAASRDD